MRDIPPDQSYYDTKICVLKQLYHFFALKLFGGLIMTLTSALAVGRKETGSATIKIL